MPGFDFKFRSSMKKKYRCLICRLPPKDPVKITSCGHRFCDDCLQDYLSEGVFICPEDRSPLDYAKVYPDPEAEVAVMASLVNCIHYKEGCKWTDELRKLQAHLNACKYDAVPCSKQCAAMIPRLLMEDHQMYTCPMRPAQCPFCARQFTAEMLEGHVGSCQYEPVYCESKCGAKVQRRFLANHRLNECTKRLLPCRYCHKEFVFDTLQNHRSQCQRYPVSCPNRCEAKLPREDLEAHLKDSCPSAALVCPFKDMGCHFKGSRQVLEDHMTTNSSQHLSLVCSYSNRQQQQIGSLRSALSALSLPTDGLLIWKITDWEHKMSRARTKEGYELCSAPFATGRHGYRLRATLFPNGNGAGEGSHLSVYIKLLAGEYDSLLQWPFSHTVSFTLCDQVGPDVAIHLTESFVPDPTWKNFQRPAGREPDALGFGFPRFVSHDTLKKRNYVKDDTLFLKVKVDSSKIIAV